MSAESTADEASLGANFDNLETPAAIPGISSKGAAKSEQRARAPAAAKGWGFSATARGGDNARCIPSSEIVSKPAGTIIRMQPTCRIPDCAVESGGHEACEAMQPDFQDILCAAVEQNEVEMVRQLLEDAGAYPNQPGEPYPACPPVWVSAWKGHVEVLKVLLKYKADPNLTTSDDGTTPVFVAAQEGHEEVLRVLLENTADPNKASADDGSTPVYVAAQDGHAEAVAVLLENNADPNLAETDDGSTPLYMAAEDGHLETVKVLLAHKADPNQATTDDATTPVYMAAQEGHADIVKVLLENNAEPNLGRTDGWTPLKKATQKGYAAIVALLKEHAAV